MEPITFPTDVLVEIFSHAISSYSVFRQLTRATRKASISWDGWDALISQGYSVLITRTEIQWTKNDEMNSFLDLPTVECSGTKWWSKNGDLHRDNDLPAIEWSHGTKEWYRNGKRHRDHDLPAIERTNGTKEWYRNGECHRDNDLPAIEWSHGTKEWYRNGKRYRRHFPGHIERPV